LFARAPNPTEIEGVIMSVSMKKNAKFKSLIAGGAALAAALALAASMPGASIAADKEKEQKISVVIGKEMKAAQDALQKNQWQEALKNLDAASQKSPLTAFDKMNIFNFKFYAEIKLQHFKEAQADLEAALATGQYSAE
jgi:outer membrane protein assembly factor BamD (BamD/ComL family)